MQPDQLIAELLARGDMNDETVVDLNRMLEAYRAGTLDPDDESYLRALHGRILDIAPEPVDVAPASPARQAERRPSASSANASAARSSPQSR